MSLCSEERKEMSKFIFSFYLCNPKYCYFSLLGNQMKFFQMSKWRNIQFLLANLAYVT